MHYLEHVFGHNDSCLYVWSGFEHLEIAEFSFFSDVFSVVFVEFGLLNWIFLCITLLLLINIIIHQQYLNIIQHILHKRNINNAQCLLLKVIFA